MNFVNILIGIGVFALILVLVVIMIIKKKPKISTIEKKESLKEDIISLKDLIQIAKDSNSSSNSLKQALLLFNDNYKIDEENKNSCISFLSFVLTHKNRDKQLFEIVHKEIKKSNKDYKDLIGKIEMSAIK